MTVANGAEKLIMGMYEGGVSVGTLLLLRTRRIRDHQITKSERADKVAVVAVGGRGPFHSRWRLMTETLSPVPPFHPSADASRRRFLPLNPRSSLALFAPD